MSLFIKKLFATGDFNKAMRANMSGDIKTAVAEFSYLAERGHADSQYWLGDMHKDPKEKLKWHYLAAKQGHSGAQFSLGLAYRNGNDIYQDDVFALMWLNLATSNRDKYRIEARDEVAKGMTDEEIARAERLMQEWQKENNLDISIVPYKAPAPKVPVPEVPAHVGNFRKGFEAHKKGDYTTAIYEFRSLAKKGHSAAQYNLGVMYKHEQGVQQDYIIACMWFSIATSSGHEYGAWARDKITKIMTLEQIAEAKKLAREWLAKNQK